ncbi:hypothetical protein ACU686_09275 [Yinghuangia aomiensis]
MREFASRTGELPAEEGYPASSLPAIAAFYERAGSVTTLGAGVGSVTVIGAISPPGGDFTEPVTAHTPNASCAACGLWTGRPGLRPALPGMLSRAASFLA